MSASSRGWFVVLVLSVVSLPPCIALVPVPIFDMSRRLDAGETSSLARALRDVGFIAVSGLGVDERMIADAISASKTLFDLPFAEKERLVVGNHMLSRGWEVSIRAVRAGGVASFY
jgi:isopenicillin N synthase-like dioxygenase